ncbi:coproporphyrinogen III oxidase [Citrobacter koseri]|uniref:Coproporphyrinogen III oxidase n=1 Tax=Citrobacter koseri TaxID=545 RepID=A0A2X2YIF2_CITKO|nr:coproporphyrinogen III oxidase [Citrobacter koseri]
MVKLPPLSLYIHIPWCVQKCPYCDFNSHALKGEVPHDDYVQHLLSDLDTNVAYAQGREVKTIFIGGGTPSLLSGRQCKRCWTACGRACRWRRMQKSRWRRIRGR